MSENKLVTTVGAPDPSIPNDNTCHFYRIPAELCLQIYLQAHAGFRESDDGGGSGTWYSTKRGHVRTFAASEGERSSYIHRCKPVAQLIQLHRQEMGGQIVIKVPTESTLVSKAEYRPTMATEYNPAALTYCSRGRCGKGFAGSEDNLDFTSIIIKGIDELDKSKTDDHTIVRLLPLPG